MDENTYRELEPLYEMAKADIPTWDTISLSAVQRKYQLGYNRAARLLEHLAEFGVLTYNKMNGSYRRAVSASPEHPK